MLMSSAAYRYGTLHSIINCYHLNFDTFNLKLLFSVEISVVDRKRYFKMLVWLSQVLHV